MYRYPEAIGRMVSCEKFTIIFKVFIQKLLTSRERVHIFLLQHLSKTCTQSVLSRAPIDNRYTFKYSEGVTLVKLRFATATATQR